MNSWQNLASFILLIFSMGQDISVNGELNAFGSKHLIPDNRIDEFKNHVLEKDTIPELKDYARSWTVKFRPFLKNWLTYFEDDLDKASDMLLKPGMHSLDWRRVNDLDNLASWEPKSGFDRKEYPFRLTGYTEEGSPVVYFPIGQWNPRHAFRNGYQKELLRHFLSAGETLFNSAIANGTGEGIGIVNMDGFTLSNVASIRVVNFMLSLARLLETNYPLYAKSIIVINAPGYFSVVFDLLKNVLSSKSLKVITIYGQDKKDWFEVIKNEVPDFAIPKELYKY